jgi:hypothetical protein
MGYDIPYVGYMRVLEGYCDVNWISDVDEIYTASGYGFSLGGGTTSWESYKHTILIRSIMEEELTTLDTATIHFVEVLMDLSVVEKSILAVGDLFSNAKS